MAQVNLTRHPGLGWIEFQNQQYSSLLQNVNFQLYLISATTQAIGQIFYSLTLPWLVMRITGSTVAMGMAILLSGLPRIAFMMIGGALTDRYSPQILSVAANLFRAALLAVLTWVVLTNQVTLMFLFGLNVMIGFTDAILIPASGALTPRLVREGELKMANAIMTALGHFCGLVVPAAAGVILTRISNTGALPGLIAGDMLAAGAAFAVTTLLLVLTAVTLLSMKVSNDGPRSIKVNPNAVNQGTIKELLIFIWKQANVRAAFGLLYLVNIISSGPLFVGMPLLAVSRFSEGAQAIGLLTSAMACGSLFGAALAGFIPQPKSQPIGQKCSVVLGVLLVGLGLLFTSTRIESAIIAVLAITALVSYENVVETTQIQQNTPSALIGRMVGLLNLK